MYLTYVLRASCLLWLLLTLTVGGLSQDDAVYLRTLYEDLHRQPELSFYEKATAARMATELRQIGFEVTEGVGGYGVVGVLKNGEGPTVLVRTDTDALPVVEETDLPYASTVTTTNEEGQTVGVMHACGHDVHMSTWVGTARQLARQRKQWRGTLVFIAQPAEERNGGAIAMLREGKLYERFPKPDYGLAFHVSPAIPAGQVGYRSGYAMAFVDFMDITVRGRGGHGAYPHTTIDPVVLAARLILDLQTIVSREISPLEPAVVTVGAIHGGAKGNVIPDEVQLQLTMRSYSDAVRNAIIEKIERLGRGLAASAGLPEALMPTFKLKNEYCPSVYNDPALTERLVKRLQQQLGAGQVVEAEQSMAGEDFSYYGRTEHDIPTSLFWLGAPAADYLERASRGEVPPPALHNSRFAPDPDPAIRTGVTAMTAMVLDLLAK